MDDMSLFVFGTISVAWAIGWTGAVGLIFMLPELLLRRK